MTQTGDDRSSRTKPCPSDILSITNLARNGVDSNPGIRGERPAKIRLSHSKDFEIRKKWKYFYIKCSLISGREVLSGKFPRLRPFALLVGATCSWRWDAMILIRKTRSTWKKISTSATLTTTNVKRTGLGSNQGLPRKRPRTNRPSLGKTL